MEPYDYNLKILSSGQSTPEQITAYFKANAQGGLNFINQRRKDQDLPPLPLNPIPDNIGQIIIAASKHWPAFIVNHDGVAAQGGKESAFLQSEIARDKFNPSGLGASNDDPYNNAIDCGDWLTGFTLTVSHLLSYAVGDGPWTEIDPRWKYMKPGGNAPRWIDLNGKWAWPGVGYGQNIIDRVNNGLFKTEAPMSAQIPGFVWHPADADHYTKGRSTQIRGGAQHYTAGINSLPWLTRTSNPPVSSTFLVKHNPTMEDRGWQLVKLEDTAWTTAFANSYTVSIEYEHKPDHHGSIPDIAFVVLAQTWIDIATKVQELGLGEISLDRQGIKGHKEWVNNPSLICPDGVFVDRVVDEIKKILGTGEPDVDFSKIPTVPDPWKNHLGGNPYGKDFWIPKVFTDNINEHGGFGPVGFCVGGAFKDGAQLVQYFERARMELNENGHVSRGLVGLEALAVRSPDRLP